MTSNRIQKLLFSEYSDFEDIVLVEGPFAETDRDGRGIRQVQIGLTPSKLILASYFVEPVAVEDLGDQWRPRRGQDPDIESFELVSAYPVECVNLSVYRHRRRQTLKARFCNGKVVYYEIGGWQERKMLWSVWCERIKFLSPYESRTSISETSVGSSTSGGSSLYIVRSSLSVTQAGKPTLWCHYACAEGSWADPHLYLGPKFYEKGVNSSSLPDGSHVANNSIPTCITQASAKKQHRRSTKDPMFLSTAMEVIAAEAVELWESRKYCGRVRRRYAFSPCPYLLGGVGPWRFSKSVAYSLQTKKNVSLVDIRDDPEEFHPAVAKGRLLRTVSLEALAVPPTSQEKLRYQPNVLAQNGEPLFWTRYPDDVLLWGSAQYKVQQRYLAATRERVCAGPANKVLSIKEKKKLSRKRSSTADQNMFSRSKKNSQRGVHVYGAGGDSFPRHIYTSLKDEGEEGWLLPVSRFKSSNLAHQLTMIHKQLFQQLTTLELARARSDGDSWRSPGFRALVYFSHRISCIVANHILLEHEVQRRAQVVAKMMSLAYKCHRLHSLMSAEAVLRGLHSPAVYRLHRTWSHVRKHHATNYRRYEDLSRRYFDCRELLFQKTYDDVVQVPPFLPTLSLLVALLLEVLPELPQVQSFKFETVCSVHCRQSVLGSPSADTLVTPSSVKRLLSALHISSTQTLPSSPPHTPCRSQSHLHSTSRETLLEHLDMFFTPVSNAPAHRSLQDLQYFLDSHQIAASRYQIPINPRVRAFLLHSRHPDMRTLFRQSLLIEP